MTYENLCDLAQRHEIGIYDFPLEHNRALSVNRNGKCDIAINFAKTETESERTSLLAHEMGHCETGAFYNKDNYLDVRTKAEYRADSWAVQHLLPKTRFAKAIHSGCNEVWKLCEHFNVEPNLVVFALRYYFGIEA